jgi:hypothetical protein
VPDDAFYYLQTARNLGAGAGLTFDGIHVANGFHPLWMAVLLPLSLLIDSPRLMLRSALLVSLAASLLGAVLLYLLLRRVTLSWQVSLLGMALYFLGLYAVRSSVNGLETSLSTFLFVLALYVFCLHSGTSDSIGSTVVLALILGLLFLARTDNAFFVAIIMVLILSRTPTQKRIGQSVALVTAIALIAGPWLLWNWFSFGSPIQSSGVAVPYVLHANYLTAGHTSAELLGRSWRQFTRFLLVRREVLAFALVAWLLVGLERRIYFRSRSRVKRDALRMVAWLWAAGITLVFVHTFVRWYARTWYFDQLIVLGVITFCLFIVHRSIRRPLSRAGGRLSSSMPAKVQGFAVFFALAFAILLFTLSQYRKLNIPPYQHQVEMLDAAHWLRNNTQKDEIAAAFNAGIMGFFSDRAVVNLDGAINTAAYAAIRGRQLLCLLREAQAHYYLDYDPAMLNEYELFLGGDSCSTEMTPVDTVDRPGISWGGAKINVYRLK